MASPISHYSVVSIDPASTSNNVHDGKRESIETPITDLCFCSFAGKKGRRKDNCVGKALQRDESDGREGGK